jgi:Spy/CpxP family protein refolding chaperone
MSSGRGVFRPSVKESVMRSVMAALALALVVGLSVYGTLSAAAEESTVVLVERFQDLNLTDDQETRIAEIRKEYQPRVQEAAKEFAVAVREEVDEVQAVLTAEQKEKLRELKEGRREHRAEGVAQMVAHFKELDLTDGEITQIQDIRKGFRPRIEKALKELQGVLTDTQKKARTEALTAGKTRREVLAALNLTAEQKEKVTGVCKEVGTIVREEMEKIRDVLTEAQKAKLPELKDERREHVRDRMAHAVANFKDLNLTEEQKTKIANIRTKFRPRIHEAGNKLRAIIREEVHAIVNVLKV